MADTTIEVRFEQFEETICVPVSSVSTIEDVIKYVCKTRVDIDYNNYYLASEKNDEMLDNKKTLKETNIPAIDDPELRLRMKTSTGKQRKSVDVIKKIGVDPQTLADDIRCNNIDPNNAEVSFRDTSEFS
ncbi:unnamed protein product [Adineta steineri]|uniref:Uncharacterized protein n=1 Tax=Adineta steineri TaxID=433720 RepID=A0A815S2U1_9BILA|nr:unnamed protein product [Adineta steineri]CAF1484142.1 unnamed protein product [Adineta steineri]